MAEQEAKARLIARNDTAANWTRENPILLKGELGVETDTGKFKLGDGVNAWDALTYIACSAENVTISAIDGLQASNVQEAIAANFQSVVDGKKLLETAVTDKGGTVSKVGNVASFNELSSAIAGIPSSGSGECIITFENYAPDNKSKQEVWEELSVTRSQLAAATVGKSAIFAGGLNTNPVSNVDAYSESGVRTTLTALSATRYDLAASTVGTKAIFAGGTYATGKVSGRANVDSYDEAGVRTSLASLSVGRPRLAATAVGSKAIFAGGEQGGVNTDVDAYNDAGVRTIFTKMLYPRFALAAATAGTKAIFAGGYYTSPDYHVESYDEAGVRTSFTGLSASKYSLAATTVGTRAIFAGGIGTKYFATAESFDETGVRTSFPDLSAARAGLSATTIGSNAVFAGGNGPSAAADSYTEAGVRTTLQDLSVARTNLTSTTIGTRAVFAGGTISSGPIATVDSYGDAENTTISILGGGIYNFGDGEVTLPGSLLNPVTTSLIVKIPVNGYIKYKGETIHG